MHRSAFAFAFLLLAGTPARADEPLAPKRAITAGRDLFDRGVRQRSANDLEGARLSFAQSFAAYPSIATLQNLAVAEVETGRCVDALRHLRHYARSKNADPTFVQTDLPTFVARCDARTGHIRVLVPEGVAVLVDGKRALELPDVIDVVPGSHVVAAEGPALHASRPLSVAAGETIEQRFGNVASVAPVAVTPLAEPDLPTAPPPASVSPVVTSAPAPTPVDAVPREPFWTTRREVAAVLGATAVASIAVGIGFGAGANSEKSSISSAQASGTPWSCVGGGNARCTMLRDDKSAQRRDGIVSDVGFGLGAALAVSAVVAWFLPGAAEKSALWVSPTFERTGAGFAASARF